MRHFVVALSALHLLAGGAFAFNHRACKADVGKFCSGVKPGGGRIIQCLMSHENDVSAECKSAMKEGKEKMEEKMAACKGDKEKFCAGVQPGEGRIMKCMKEHEKDLSAGCKAAWDKKG
jgi:hypothetical protein